MTELRALITELANELDHHCRALVDDRRVTHPLADKARAELAKPKSQAEEALVEIEEVEGAMYSAGLGCDFTATRSALERLRELEGGNA